jgi:hypothetical protein
VIYLSGNDCIVALTGHLYLAETGYGGWGIFHRQSPTGRGVLLTSEGGTREQMSRVIGEMADYIEDEWEESILFVRVSFFVARAKEVRP